MSGPALLIMCIAAVVSGLCLSGVFEIRRRAAEFHQLIFAALRAASAPLLQERAEELTRRAQDSLWQLRAPDPETALWTPDLVEKARDFASWVAGLQPDPPGRFTALATCPSCQTYEVHGIRVPLPAPTAAAVKQWESERTLIVAESVGSVWPIVRYDRPHPRDESRYEVIRICRCGHQWGQV